MSRVFSNPAHSSAARDWELALGVVMAREWEHTEKGTEITHPNVLQIGISQMFQQESGNCLRHSHMHKWIEMRKYHSH